MGILSDEAQFHADNDRQVAELECAGIKVVPWRDRLAWLQRELANRTDVYARRIEEGRMQQAEADIHLDVLRAIVRDYEFRGFGGTPREWTTHLVNLQARGLELDGNGYRQLPGGAEPALNL